MILKRSKNSL